MRFGGGGGKKWREREREGVKWSKAGKMITETRKKDFRSLSNFVNAGTFTTFGSLGLAPVSCQLVEGFFLPPM
jgi:hypothetical protein